ncbi:MAG: hypothetical protein AAF517_04415 [Planctomycetota bacterium]
MSGDFEERQRNFRELDARIHQLREQAGMLDDADAGHEADHGHGAGPVHTESFAFRWATGFRIGLEAAIVTAIAVVSVALVPVVFAALCTAAHFETLASFFYFLAFCALLGAGPAVAFSGLKWVHKEMDKALKGDSDDGH